MRWCVRVTDVTEARDVCELVAPDSPRQTEGGLPIDIGESRPVVSEYIDWACLDRASVRRACIAAISSSLKPISTSRVDHVGGSPLQLKKTQ